MNQVVGSVSLEAGGQGDKAGDSWIFALFIHSVQYGLCLLR